MKIGSLFAGIGGLELGLERAGAGHTVWQVEQDEYCRKILARHWPDAARYDDVCKAGGPRKGHRDVLAPVDVICGGFPCQDLSFAGKGAGLSGARSGLWFEFARIVRELRPRYVVVENVPALLSRGLGVVLGGLAASGYDAVWDCIPAAAVGAPQRRERAFLVAHALRNGLDATQHDAGKARSNPTDQQAQPANCYSRLEGWYQGGSECAGHWLIEPDVGRVADGVPARVDRLRALGNAVVPQVAEVVGRVLLQIEEKPA